MLYLTVVKLGNIGSAPLLDLLFDERADRKNIDVRVFGSGAKMGEIQAEEVANFAKDYDKTQLFLVVSPNATLPGPTKAREILAETGKPVIVITDAPGKKIKESLAENVGYLIITTDPMIGARREFLDVTEMCIFNGFLQVLLAETGVMETIRQEVESVLSKIESGIPNPEVPRLVIKPETAVNSLNFSNPFALSKAIAAANLAKHISSVTTKACFMIKDREEYLKLIEGAHQTLVAAVGMAEEARNLEKASGELYRSPHAKDGKMVTKTKFYDKPM
ncbi:MAG: F420-dependent methylenetetrahydromethanopterin dehydrogenase [Candidatus Heimdallarchaeota archaeon]